MRLILFCKSPESWLVLGAFFLRGVFDLLAFEGVCYA